MSTIKKLNLSDIKKGSLVNEIKDKTIEFIHNGEEYSVDIRIKTLPFIETESLFTRWNQGKGENVVAEWISKALVDDKGELQFTEKEVDENFVQPMASAIFEQVWGADNLKKITEILQKKDQEKKKQATLQAKKKSSTS